MHRVLLFATRHPWPVLLFLGLVTLLAALQLPSLRLEITAEGMMVRGDPAREFYLEARNTFGTENVTVVYLEDSDLFEPEVLEAIGELVERIEALPEVFRTDSLFSVRNLRTQEGYTRTDPYFAEIPESVEKARQVASLALKNPLVRGNLLSRDLRAMAINRCPPWRAKRRRVVPGSREATRDTRRAEGAKGDPKGASERGVQSYGRPVCSRNELAMLWRNAG